MMLPRGMNFAATWHHPPGAAQRSMQTFEELRKSYFLFICVGVQIVQGHAAFGWRTCKLGRSHGVKVAFERS